MSLPRPVLFCPVLLIFLACYGCISTGKSLADKKFVVAESPQMHVGDTWEWTQRGVNTDRNTIRHTVIEVATDGSCQIMEELKNGDRYLLFYDKNREMNRIINLRTGNEEPMWRTPPEKRLQFPLKVGASWKDRYSESTNMLDKRYYKNEYTVMDYQEIELNGEKYEAFAIKRKHMPVSGSWTRYEWYWYVPAIKNIVRTEPEWYKGYELTSFTPGTTDKKTP